MSSGGNLVQFSIIVPTFNRVLDGLLLRALRSIQSQSYRFWEAIVVDDCSTEPVEKLVESLKDSRISCLRQEKRGERLLAWNRGFKEAKTDWLAMLCSDDALLPHCLEVLSSAVQAHPEAKVFNFQEALVGENGSLRIRNLFQPKQLETGHEFFCSGGISTGNFIFKKECLSEVGYFPETSNFWEFSRLAKEEFPEIAEKCYKGELGNPWGEDYFLFFKLTRKYHSIPLPVVLMLKYPGKGRPLNKLPWTTTFG